MIYLIFQYNREPLNFVVKNKEIYYSQRKFGGGIWVRCIPPPENLMKAIVMSRNKINANLINLFKFTQEEIKEYQDAKTEEDLAEKIIIDAKSKGCIFVNKMNKVDESDDKKGVIA